MFDEMIASENVLIRRVRTLSRFGETDMWDKANMLDRFHRPWRPDQPVPRTEFRGLHDGETFVFRFDIEDKDIVLGEGESEDDRVMGSDRAEIFFSTDETLSLYYGLEIDPRGNVLDYSAKHYRNFDRTWKMPGHFVVESRITDYGYLVEGSFELQALRDLNLLNENGQVIAGIFRAEFSHLEDGSVDQDWMPWIDPQTQTPDFHVPEAFGRMIFEL